MMLAIGLHPLLRGIIFLITLSFTYASINRRAIVTLYNPVRTSSDPNTPMQVGNGNFAFGADVTGLQTFLPFAIMSVKVNQAQIGCPIYKVINIGRD